MFQNFHASPDWKTPGFIQILKAEVVISTPLPTYEQDA